jgi:hypothetical protein
MKTLLIILIVIVLGCTKEEEPNLTLSITATPAALKVSEKTEVKATVNYHSAELTWEIDNIIQPSLNNKISFEWYSRTAGNHQIVCSATYNDDFVMKSIAISVK